MAAVVHEYVRPGFFQMEHGRRRGSTLLHTHGVEENNIILLIPVREGGRVGKIITPSVTQYCYDYILIGIAKCIRGSGDSRKGYLTHTHTHTNDSLRGSSNLDEGVVVRNGYRSFGRFHHQCLKRRHVGLKELRKLLGLGKEGLKVLRRTNRRGGRGQRFVLHRYDGVVGHEVRVQCSRGSWRRDGGSGGLLCLCMLRWFSRSSTHTRPEGEGEEQQ